MMTSCCPHVTTGVGRLTSEDLSQLLRNSACDICRRTSSTANLWLCLFPDCYMMGCAESRNDHSTVHNQQNPNHCLQLNVSNKRVWCYKCCEEVHLASNQPQIPGVLGEKAGGKVTARQDQDASDIPLGLVGLSNLGNTCYMNSALQCLSNTPSLTRFFINCPEMVPRDVKPGLGRAYLKLMDEMWKDGGPGYVAPASVLNAIRQTYPMFRGYQQHDSQEFLRCFMDQLHQELSEPSEEDDDEEEEKMTMKQDLDLTTIADNNFDSLSELDSGGNSRSNSEAGEGDEYETADSGVDDQSGSDVAIVGRKRKLTDHSQAKDSGLGSIRSTTTTDDGESHKLVNVPESPGSRRKAPDSGGNLSDVEYADAMSDTALSSRSASPPRHPSSPSPPPQSPSKPRLTPQQPNKRQRVRQYHSVISDIFDGKLVSSVQCLACDRVSLTTETFQDLSLSIPSQDALTVVRQGSANGRQDQSQDGWMSWAWNWVWGWFYGLDVSLSDCLAYFFSADELKGDNMYSCEKCKKLRNGIKYSQVTELPDTLCVHLKRFRHDFAFSSKISTRVTFPLQDLDMSPWLHTDCVSKQTKYHLTGVICHHGMAGGGHYTSYCLNYIDNIWYEFDDSFVRPVDATTVAAAEAYVLFYRKNSGGMDNLRGKVTDLAEQDSQSLVKFYISNKWLNKFYTLAEPGPIDNSSVICRHSGVLPYRLETAHYLCTAVPPAVWRFLYDRFGGSVAVNRLQRCDICYAEAEEEERQKQFQLEEFKALHAAETEECNSGGDMYCVASGWFRAWESWVLGRARETPGPVDNRCIVVSRSSGSTLRPHSDYLKFSEDIWSMFLSLYGGGPEVVLTGGGGGGIRISNPRTQTIANLAARLRAKSLSEASARQKRASEADKSDNGRASQQENVEKSDEGRISQQDSMEAPVSHQESREAPESQQGSMEGPMSQQESMEASVSHLESMEVHTSDMIKIPVIETVKKDAMDVNKKEEQVYEKNEGAENMDVDT